MGRKKAEELLGMVVDGAILIGNRPRVVLPKFLDEVLTEDEREKVSKCFNPLNCSALLESESWASKEDPKLGELASRLMEALRAKYRRTWREDHLEAAGLGFWALHLCPDLLRSARLALPPEHRWVLSSLGLAFEARQPDVRTTSVSPWSTDGSLLLGGADRYWSTQLRASLRTQRKPRMQPSGLATFCENWRQKTYSSGRLLRNVGHWSSWSN